MAEKHGNLSINSDNLFPIIKKWLYSDHDIFYRELISNGCDAITKLKKLDMMGEYQLPADFKPQIQIIVNPEEKTLKFIDNGLGMTMEEVDEYINQIAFSGATDFIEKYKDKANDDQIIGHFGLGFYSAFMVADQVTIDTLSYKEGATPVHWTCDGGTEFDMTDGTKEGVGTEITLYLNEESLQFANEYRAREVIEKYCSFMPTPIFLSKANAEPTEEEPKPLNDTNPLWAKNPKDCTEEEYKEFYRKVFLDYKEPLFWIHLNMDYPFNLKGILYFPKINTEYDSIEGTIKLYNNQVFIADNIKEVIPEFLMLLKGVIDCPDLPLNVSRSALQNDGFVKKISEYITKKVADKLTGMCKTEKENYEKYWDDISPFIKFGCLKDGKFCDKMNDYILFKNLEDEYLTLPELLIKEEEAKAVDADGNPVEAEVVDTDNTSNAEGAEEKDDRKVVYYVTDKVLQGQYIKLFKEQNMQAVILDHSIDTSFITQLEQRNEHYKFMRIDADLTESLKDETTADELNEVTDTLTEVFKNALNNDKLTVKVEKLKNESISSIITLSEEGRRMQDMMKMYAMNGMGAMDMSMFAADQTLTLNANNSLVKYIFENKDSEHVPMFCEQLYDLAVLANQQLSVDAMTKFVERSNKIMMLLTK
ncbi:MAG: molecular chaperone HtpG [Lachnospiraceae bacterium]|nr:molecular chaperone HtpG [Lachnospiraceae bacterium]